MTPKAWCSKKVLEKRSDILFAGRMTPHTPHTPTMFPLLQQLYGLRMSAPHFPCPGSGIHCPAPWYHGDHAQIQNAPMFEDPYTGMTADMKRLVPM
eukprot:373841-Rhodomonas_salina.1